MRSSRHNQRWPRPRDGPSHRLAITVPCCAHFREGPVLAILAMLALKDALCVAPGGSAPLFPFRSAPWPPMFQAGTGKRRLNRTRKPARHDRSHALTTQKGTSWRCGNRGHFGVALTVWTCCARSRPSGSCTTIRPGPRPERRPLTAGNCHTAGAILDRVIHRSHRIELRGESLRKRQALAAAEGLTNTKEK